MAHLRRYKRQIWRLLKIHPIQLGRHLDRCLLFSRDIHLALHQTPADPKGRFCPVRQAAAAAPRDRTSRSFRMGGVQVFGAPLPCHSRVLSKIAKSFPLLCLPFAFCFPRVSESSPISIHRTLLTSHLFLLCLFRATPLLGFDRRLGSLLHSYFVRRWSSRDR